MESKIRFQLFSCYMSTSKRISSEIFLGRKNTCFHTSGTELFLVIQDIFPVGFADNCWLNHQESLVRIHCVPCSCAHAALTDTIAFNCPHTTHHSHYKK